MKTSFYWHKTLTANKRSEKGYQEIEVACSDQAPETSDEEAYDCVTQPMALIVNAP